MELKLVHGRSHTQTKCQWCASLTTAINISCWKGQAEGRIISHSATRTSSLCPLLSCKHFFPYVVLRRKLQCTRHRDQLATFPPKIDAGRQYDTLFCAIGQSFRSPIHPWKLAVMRNKCVLSSEAYVRTKCRNFRCWRRNFGNCLDMAVETKRISFRLSNTSPDTFCDVGRKEKTVFLWTNVERRQHGFPSKLNPFATDSVERN